MRAPGLTERGPFLWDCGLALIVAVVQVAGSSVADPGRLGTRSLDWFAYGLLLAGPVALVFRRREPLAVLLVTVAATGIFLALGHGYGPIFLAPACAFVTAAVLGSRWWTYPLAGVAFLLVGWPLPALLGRPADGWMVFGVAAALAALVAGCEGVRQRRAALDAHIQRAEAARRDDRAQRDRLAAEERLAAASELYELVAQSLSVISVQSSLALEMFDRKPAQATAALAGIKATSKRTQVEVHAVARAIRLRTEEANAPGRRDGAPGRAAEATDGIPGVLAPGGGQSRSVRPVRVTQPGIADLDALLHRVRASGLTVDTRVIGTPVALPGVLDETAARIIQESLANVQRHAPGADATVTVRYTAESVDLTIDNTRPTSRSAAGSGGRDGIIDMRERAHGLGGQLTAGPRPSGGFRVAARLPTQLVTLVPAPAPESETAAVAEDSTPA